MVRFTHRHAARCAVIIAIIVVLLRPHGSRNIVAKNAALAGEHIGDLRITSRRKEPVLLQVQPSGVLVGSLTLCEYNQAEIAGRITGRIIMSNDSDAELTGDAAIEARDYRSIRVLKGAHCRGVHASGYSQVNICSGTLTGRIEALQYAAIQVHGGDGLANNPAFQGLYANGDDCHIFITGHNLKFRPQREPDGSRWLTGTLQDGHPIACRVYGNIRLVKWPPKPPRPVTPAPSGAGDTPPGELPTSAKTSAAWYIKRQFPPVPIPRRKQAP